MPKITYIEFNGQEHVVDVEAGLSIMEGAKRNGITGIDADCGGACSCGTCHVYVSPDWLARMAGRTPIENATIEFVDNVQPNSRLSCQIRVKSELDGLIVYMPESQR